MKAQVINQFGDAHVFELNDLIKPKVKAGYALIKVAASSVNPVDCKIRSGLHAQLCPDFPAILQGDVAGTIDELAEDVKDFKVGDEIYACAGGVHGEPGALSEYMLVDAKLMARKPKNLNALQAAALPLVSITAWEALFEKVNIKKGQTILIHAGAGGVGHIAIQLAKYAGAKVYTTVSSEKKASIARSLGADEVIFYKQESVSDYVKRLTQHKGFDIVFDTVGGENIDRSIEAVKLYGNVVTIQANSTHNLSPLHAKGASLHVVFMLIPLIYHIQRERHGEILNQLTQLVEQNKLKPLLDEKEFDFYSIGDAHARLESGKAMGKVAIKFNA